MKKYYTYFSTTSEEIFYITAEDITEADKILITEFKKKPAAYICRIGFKINFINNSKLIAKSVYPLKKNDDGEYVADLTKTPELILKNNGIIHSSHIKDYEDLRKSIDSVSGENYDCIFIVFNDNEYLTMYTLSALLKTISYMYSTT